MIMREQKYNDVEVSKIYMIRAQKYELQDDGRTKIFLNINDMFLMRKQKYYKLIFCWGTILKLILKK